MDVKSDKYKQRSRYSSMSHYIWNSPRNLPEYSDEKTTVNAEVVDLLKK
jgi:hypothetical protein